MPGLRVLVVDDLLDTIEVVCMLLDTLGHDARGATSGTRALEVAAAHDPQLVICDIGMPDLSGYEVARELRRRAAGKPMHLVAISGWAANADRVEALAAGFDQHFLKPATEAVIREILAAATARFATTPTAPA